MVRSSSIIVLFFLSTGGSLADPAVVTIDAEAVLKQNFSIPTGRIRRVEECLPLGGGGGLGSKKVPCEYFDVITHIEVEQLKSLTFGKADVSDLDPELNKQVITINNCLSADYPYERHDQYHTNEYVDYSNTTVFTKTSSSKYSFQVEASLFKFLGGKYGEDLNETVTYSVTDKSEYHKDVSHDMKVDVKLMVPPKKRYIISMMDAKKSITLPITISAVLRAEVHEQIRSLNGDVHQDTKIKTLAETDVDKRTVTVGGSLYYKASDQTVQVDPKEENADCSKSVTEFVEIERSR